VVRYPYLFSQLADTVGPALRVTAGYRLYRESPNAPGVACSERRQDRICSGLGWSAR
jgi:hypothetical protein